MQIVSIILAGGKGTRMHSADRHKVCFEIDGRPAINRALDVYRACGIEQHVVVVGALAGQVIETVGQEYEGVLFAYQAEQRGTGHAAKQGARILADLRYAGPVLVVAGDRLVDAQVAERLIAEFRSTDSDMVFLIGQRNNPRSSRVLRRPDGTVLGVVEYPDWLTRHVLAQIRQMALAGAANLDAQARQLVEEAFRAPKKAATALGDFWNRLTDERALTPEEVLDLIPEEQTLIHLGEGLEPYLTMTPDEVAQSDETNLSVYLVRAQALHYALARLTDENAQGEEYLTDIVNILAQARDNGRRQFSIRTLKVETPTSVMGFNNPAQLLEVENAFRARRTRQEIVEPGVSPGYRPIREWQRLFASLQQAHGTALQAEASDREARRLGEETAYIYGDTPELINERLDAYQALLDVAARTLGVERPVLLSRAPGRINIMGRHVDHQGGRCNLMAIDREILVAASLRDDDEVHLYNVHSDQFGPRQFSMGELLAELTWDDWLSLVDSDKVHQMVLREAGDWAQYVRASFLRLQKHYTNVKLRGMDMVVHGTIPVAAGLSSSSAVVVSTAEAIVASHGLDMRPRQFVDLCGEGEWFVGTRGGSADHAAMKFAQREAVINVRLLGLDVGDATRFPDGYRLVFCNSHIKAQKAAASREVFNQRVACYHIGVQLIKQLYPQYAPLITHLRDINTRNLPLRLVDVYRMLLKLPERVTRQELASRLPADVLEPLIGAHTDDEVEYPIRGVVLYGLAECERSRLCPRYLQVGDMAGLGKLMRISHDGDRVAQHDQAWNSHPYQGPANNAYLLDLMDDLESGEPERVLAAQLHFQPGAYGCSTSELDLMVDIALRTEGMMGAQLAGAGLGGGMMVLAREDSIPELKRNMEDVYYQPRDLEPAVLVCVPIAGSGVLAMEDGIL
ncbi:MAG: Galactokinase [Anaerolineales bacterium]|nr:Galactokinase [Anaerolineales bacterium]